MQFSPFEPFSQQWESCFSWWKVFPSLYTFLKLLSFWDFFVDLHNKLKKRLMLGWMQYFSIISSKGVFTADEFTPCLPREEFKEKPKTIKYTRQTLMLLIYFFRLGEYLRLHWYRWIFILILWNCIIFWYFITFLFLDFCAHLISKCILYLIVWLNSTEIKNFVGGSLKKGRGASLRVSSMSFNEVYTWSGANLHCVHQLS